MRLESAGGAVKFSKEQVDYKQCTGVSFAASLTVLVKRNTCALATIYLLFRAPPALSSLTPLCFYVAETHALIYEWAIIG